MENVWYVLRNAILLNLLVLCVVSSTFFGVTSDLYKGFLAVGAHIATIHVMQRSTDVSDIKRAEMKCSRICAHNEDCNAYYVDFWDLSLSCKLLSINESSNYFYDTFPWLQMFDKVTDAQAPTARMSCLRNNETDCASCFHEGCTGKNCDICNLDCHDCYTNFPSNFTLAGKARCLLWSGPFGLSQYPVTCVKEKLLLHDRFSFPNGTTINSGTSEFDWIFLSYFTKTTHKYLYIELYSENDTMPHTALYSDFSCNASKQLTVGPLINGTAGNGLGAPFSQVPFIEDPALVNPSCGKFWNISQSYGSSANISFDAANPCPKGVTSFFGKPNTTSGVFNSGISWSTLTNVSLIGIKIYLI